MWSPSVAVNVARGVSLVPRVAGGVLHPAVLPGAARLAEAGAAPDAVDGPAGVGDDFSTSWSNDVTQESSPREGDELDTVCTLPTQY